MIVDTPYNVLVSFAYLKSPSFAKALHDAVIAGKINLMIDSGAFSVHNSKSCKHVNLQNYVAFLKDFKTIPEKYVMLDVIGNRDKSVKNYEYMIQQDLQPMFVATMFDKDYDYINQTLTVNKNICVAGGATTKGDWMTKRYQDVFLNSNKQARIHGLAYVTFPKMLQLNLASVDSSTWKVGAAKFGLAKMFVPAEGLKIIAHVDYLKKRKRIPYIYARYFQSIGVTPDDYKISDNHFKETSIEFFASTYAACQMQRYCYRHGLRYFVALSTEKDLMMYLYFANNINVNYKEWKARFS